MLDTLALVRLVLCVLLALAIPATAFAAPPSVERGLVLRVRPRAILVQELDGTRDRIPVSKTTRVVLNGRRARLRDLHRGDVVYVMRVGRLPATRIRAFS
ncbi:MAG TPA: hypothetical protein VGU02_15765 [Gaiellaceae bacterium]|nr:hypothetical protein [Gaiellaceae bacterium]